MSEDKLQKQIEEDSLYRKKMMLVPSYIIGGLSMLSLIIYGIVSNSTTLPGYAVFIYIGLMFLMTLSIMWPGFAFADYMLKRKKNE